MKELDVKLQLVISGIPGYFKLRSKHNDLFRVTAVSLRNCLDYLETKLSGNIELHGLFNAYTEKIMAERANGKEINVPFKSIFPKGLHADSGGLQMITLGKGTIEKEDRIKIYNTQMQFAHYAMSFDEIPSVVKDDRRYYLPHLVTEKGIESGFNLKEQYDYFESNKSTCKIIPIVQGWGIDDTDKFADGLFKELTPEQKDSLDIIASGFPNSSIYASAKRVFDMINAKNIPNKAKQHIHLLGVTGFKRLIPVLEIIKTGLTPQLKILSFDSVSLSMSYVMGSNIPTVDDFLKGDKIKIKLGKTRTAETDAYWKQIYDFWKDDPNFIFDDLEDFIQHSYYNETYVSDQKKPLKLTSGYQQYEYYLKADENGNYTEENKKIADLHFIKVLKQEQYYILYQIHNYVKILEAFLQNKIKLEHIFSGKDLTIFKALERVTTNDEFNDWYEYVKKITGFKISVLSDDDTTDAAFCLFENEYKTEEVTKLKNQTLPNKQEETDTQLTNILF